MTAPSGQPLIDMAWLGAAERFRKQIADHTGLSFENDKLSWLYELLARRAKAGASQNLERHLSSLSQPGSQEEWLLLMPELTVGETYFFRHAEQFDALREHILPERLAMATGRVPRILSAGCSTGDEAYSIAMTLATMPGVSERDAQIDAVDINPEVIDKARKAHYRSWSLRDTPETVRMRWFRQQGDIHVLDDRIRDAVRFSQRNLVDGDDPFWQAGAFDVVLCRNVLMYFRPDQLSRVLERFARAMAPGGYLLLGHAESLRGLTSDFELCQSHGTFYHRRKSREQAQQPKGLQAERQARAPTPGVRQLPATQGSTTTAAAADAPLAAPGPKHRWHGPDLPKSVMQLFMQDRFNEALKALQALEGTGEQAPPLTQVLHALLLLQVGTASEAVAWCRRALEAHPFHPDLQHALALSLAAQGELAQAMDSDQRATYLDPNFAMPQLHLSMLAKQRGDALGGRQANAMALRLLAREDHDRIQLFGGGFGRDALIQLCKMGVSQEGGRT